ncbi:leucine-rich repeat-containing protein 43-like isoform X2 [Tubulanus polymorphus]|uniref:leucine-rich repeat-containing protein 43-like isoform X2 n=1 Tax=Tubulanus polymorphus TaxID=672921 RepID=UPI003DA58D84
MSVVQVDNRTASAAFRTQLSTLCLKEFPCGLGSWIETNQTVSPIDNVVKLEPIKTSQSRFGITLKDYGANYERAETREEYVNSKYSPWHLDYSWSNEACNLRMVAAKSPWLIDDRFVFNYFKTLRIIDKNVTRLDSGLLKLKLLEELTLSANFLETVDSNNLPKNVKVLELCANEISDLSALCRKPPLLEHLGLGYNKIYSIDDYISGETWPNLLSLDLGRNNLSDLLDIVRKLSTLPKLRNLILQGNPLALIAGYRGYTIDSLRELTILDDLRISADEKHHFKGLAKRREFILDEAKVRFAVTCLKGIPMPEELKNPDEQPEYPIIQRKYYVQFMFLEDSSSKAEVFELLGETSSDSNSYTQRTELTEPDNEVATEAPTEEPNENKTSTCLSPDLRSVSFAHSMENIHHVTSGSIAQPISKAPLDSEKILWAEETEMDWFKNVTRDNLLGLRDFLLKGIDISVMEEKVLAYPAEQAAGENSSRTGSAKSKSKDKSAKPGKDAKGKSAKDDKKDDKKKGKKKEPEVELQYMTPEYTTLASFHMSLEEILEGEYELEETLVHGEIDIENKTEEVKAEKSVKGKGKKSPTKGGKKEESKTQAAKNSKDDKKKKNEKQVADDDEEEPTPEPLEIIVKLKLHHWTTAMDSVHAEQERATTRYTTAKS